MTQEPLPKGASTASILPEAGGAFFSMGRSTYRVPASLHAENREKLVSALAPLRLPNCSVVYLEGGPSLNRNDTDHEPIFRQESYFHYLFGVREPDCAGCIDVRTRKSVLFVPRLPPEYATFMGKIKSTDEFRKEYGVDEVRYIDEAEACLVEMLTGRLQKGDGVGDKVGASSADCDNRPRSPDGVADENGGGVGLGARASGDEESRLLLLRGPNSDSGNIYAAPTFKTATEHASELFRRADSSLLHPILAECRVIKSSTELDLLRHATELTSFAHAYVMRNTSQGMMEYQGESLFRHYCYFNFGARHVGYTPICGCGPNSAVLHYGHAGAPNDWELRNGDLCLFDMGAEYFCYGSDVTCTFPANGTFTDAQRAVYEGVLNAQRAVIGKMKPGVSWVDCHKAAEGEILKALIRLGIVVLSDGDETTVENLVELRLGAVFMPHGLGHFIGIDTHDVGGYLPGHPDRILKPGLKSLRTARVLREGMVITVEPGCYFIDHLLDEALSEGSGLTRYLDKDILNGFRGFGGVRLEDVVAVTEGGCVNYTLCPRTVEEVEGVARGGKWPPMVDVAPELRRERLTDSNALSFPIPASPPSV